MANRLPVDFNTNNPPLVVTNPDRAKAMERGETPADGTYPMHLCLPDLEGEGGHGVREIEVVGSAKEEKDARARGFMTHHEADGEERKARGLPALPTPKPKGVTVPKGRPTGLPAIN
jgi:hypothetical protein